jgi:hypothetical protein
VPPGAANRIHREALDAGAHGRIGDDPASVVADRNRGEERYDDSRFQTNEGSARLQVGE